MTSTIFLAVIFAAALHAIWNALVKSGADKFTSMTGVVLGHIPLALILIPFFPTPNAESLPYLFASIVLHTGYQLFLLYSYRIGDLTQVYPIARGTAPMLVAGFSVLVLGVELKPLQLAAVLIIGAGVISLSLVRHQNGLRNTKAGLLAIVTGFFIASYSLVDGTGARLAQTAVGFYSWLSIANGIVFAIIIGVIRPDILRELPRTGKRVFLIGGNASFIAYVLVVWAFTQAPIAVVTALRETSIIFALLIGVFALGEKLNLIKVFSIIVTLLGAALLRFAR